MQSFDVLDSPHAQTIEKKEQKRLRMTNYELRINKNASQN